MKYTASFLIIITLLILTSCDNSQQTSISTISHPIVEMPMEVLPTVEPKISDTLSKISYENEIKDYVTTDDTIFDIEELLLQNLSKIIRIMPEFIQYCKNPVYLSENSRVILATAGDLNNDGNSDLTVVVEFSAEDKNSLGYAEGEFAFGVRHLYVLLGNSDESYTIANKNESLILERWMGGVYGDPLNSVIIEDGVLCINHYGGSSSRWGYDMRFAYNDEQFVLSYMTVLYHSTYAESVEETLCDFVNHRIERYLRNNYANENYFLYSGELPEKTYLFDNTTFDEITAYANISFLPDISYYQFDKFDKFLELKISASQALDIIMMEHFPDFQKVYISWSQENRDTYSKLLFYEVPDYYYQGATGTIGYFELKIHENNGEVSELEHIMIFHLSEAEKTEFYYLDDNSEQDTKLQISEYSNPIDEYFLPRINNASFEAERRKYQDTYKGVWKAEFNNVIQWLNDKCLFDKEIEDTEIYKDNAKNLIDTLYNSSLDIEYWGNGTRSSLNQLQGEIYRDESMKLINNEYQFLDLDYSKEHYE